MSGLFDKVLHADQAIEILISSSVNVQTYVAKPDRAR